MAEVIDCNAYNMTELNKLETYVILLKYHKHHGIVSHWAENQNNYFFLFCDTGYSRKAHH